MQILHDKIIREGQVLDKHILKVDSFLNHQVDPAFMYAIGQEFVARFVGETIDKVLTIESSGIAPAIMTALLFKVPMIFARKQRSLTLKDDLYVTSVFSFTKQQTTEVTISHKYLNEGDRVLIIDDFLAYGEAALGMARIVEAAGGEVVGIGSVIEKSFQSGAQRLREAGYRVESLARIASLENGSVQFAEQLDVQ